MMPLACRAATTSRTPDAVGRDLGRAATMTPPALRTPPRRDARHRAAAGAVRATRGARGPGSLRATRRGHVWEQFGETIQVAASYRLGDPGTGWEFRVGGRLLWVGFPHDRVGTQPMTTVLVTLAAGLVLAILAAWWLARRIVAPLERLDAAAAVLGRGERPGAAAGDRAARARSRSRAGSMRWAARSTTCWTAARRCWPGCRTTCARRSRACASRSRC